MKERSNPRNPDRLHLCKKSCSKKRWHNVNFSLHNVFSALLRYLSLLHFLVASFLLNPTGALYAIVCSPRTSPRKS